MFLPLKTTCNKIHHLLGLISHETNNFDKFYLKIISIIVILLITILQTKLVMLITMAILMMIVKRIIQELQSMMLITML